MNCTKIKNKTLNFFTSDSYQLFSSHLMDQWLSKLLAGISKEICNFFYLIAKTTRKWMIHYMTIWFVCQNQKKMILKWGMWSSGGTGTWIPYSKPDGFSKYTVSLLFTEIKIFDFTIVDKMYPKSNIWVPGISEGKLNKVFLHFLPSLIIFHAVPLVHSTLKNHQICQKTNNEEKPCSTCLKPIFLADSGYPKIRFR